jgi:hypothetical protein
MDRRGGESTGLRWDENTTGVVESVFLRLFKMNPWSGKQARTAPELSERMAGTGR